MLRCRAGVYFIIFWLNLCFNGPVPVGCDLYKCFSNESFFPSCTSFPSLAAVFPTYFLKILILLTKYFFPYVRQQGYRELGCRAGVNVSELWSASGESWRASLCIGEHSGCITLLLSLSGPYEDFFHCENWIGFLEGKQMKIWVPSNPLSPVSLSL